MIDGLRIQHSMLDMECAGPTEPVRFTRALACRDPWFDHMSLVAVGFVRSVLGIPVQGDARTMMGWCEEAKSHPIDLELLALNGDPIEVGWQRLLTGQPRLSAI